MVNRMDLSKVLIAAVVPVAAVLVSACGVGEASTTSEMQQPADTPMPVEVVLPVKTEIFATYHTTTTLASDLDAPVVARVEGEVVEILVEEGDLVIKGQVLARLDGDRLRLEMNEAKASLNKAAGEYERMIGLHERGLVSSASFEGTKYDMNALQAGYKLKRLNYEYTSIRAPISGVVSARGIKPGQHVAVNDETFRVTDTSQLVAHLKIPQNELGKISAGQETEIRVDAMPEDVFLATIARISPTIDSRNGTFRATANIDNRSGLLAPGMFGRFDIAYERRDGALTIPAAAILEEDNETVVYVVKDGTAVRRIIEAGIEYNGVVEVLSGVGEDDRIVVTGHRSLRDGSRVLASIPGDRPVIG